MSDIFDLIAVELSDKKLHLFESPIGGVVRKGDLVMVETDDGEVMGYVEARTSMIRNSSDFRFAVDSFKAELPLPKVTGRFIRFTEEDY